MYRGLVLSLGWGSTGSDPSSPCRFLSASSAEGLLGSTLRPEVAVPWLRGVREE